MQDLEGKTALVTGGASGIGLALARTLLAEGMQVVITDVDTDALASAQASLQGANTQLLALALDVTDRAGFAQVAKAVGERFGNLHLLCNNAGVMAMRETATKDGYDVQLQTNHLSHFLLTKELWPLLKKGSGSSRRSENCQPFIYCSQRWFVKGRVLSAAGSE